MTREEAIKWFEGEKEAAERQVVAFESCFKCFKSAHRKIVAYNDMAIAALREQPQWISVEERLPTPYQNVIVWRNNYLDNSGCVDIDFTFVFNGGEVEWADHMRTWKSVVTHWMPLPEPPKEEV